MIVDIPIVHAARKEERDEIGVTALTRAAHRERPDDGKLLYYSHPDVENRIRPVSANAADIKTHHHDHHHDQHCRRNLVQ